MVINNLAFFFDVQTIQKACKRLIGRTIPFVKCLLGQSDRRTRDRVQMPLTYFKYLQTCTNRRHRGEIILQGFGVMLQGSG